MTTWTCKTFPDPAQGTAVRIVRVSDKRYFRSNTLIPSDMSIDPSSDGSAPLAPRALGRNGDINVLLPEGRTVKMLATEALAEAFRAAGFSVAQPTDPRYATALPVNADIRRFWGWTKFSTWAVARQYEVSMHVDAPIGGLARGRWIGGTSQHRSANFWGSHASSGHFQQVIAEALQDFNADLVQAINVLPTGTDRAVKGEDSGTPAAVELLAAAASAP